MMSPVCVSLRLRSGAIQKKYYIKHTNDEKAPPIRIIQEEATNWNLLTPLSRRRWRLAAEGVSAAQQQGH